MVSAHINHRSMLCVLFSFYLSVIAAKKMAAAEMDVSNWRCVIHLSTPQIINNNLLTRRLLKLNHLIHEFTLTFTTNMMEFPSSVPVISTRT